jgi:hypothetical protein
VLLAKQEKMAELQAKWDEEARQKAEEDAQTKAELSAADEEYAAYLENKVANGLLAEQDYQNVLYDLKKQVLESQFSLLVAAGKSETAEAKRIKAALLKEESDHVRKDKALKQDMQAFELKIAGGAATLLKEGLALVEDNLDKKSTAYQIFKAARKTAELAEIGMNLQAEMQANSKASSENPLNGITAGATQLVITNGLSIARALAAGIKIAAFAKGGRTDQLAHQVPVGMLAGLLSGASGGSSATFAGGPVTGPTIGLIGEAGAELVIPNWLYADPKQANLMGFLEAQVASRGGAFAGGGSTTGSSAVAADVDMLERIAKGQEAFRDEITT